MTPIMADGEATLFFKKKQVFKKQFKRTAFRSSSGFLYLYIHKYVLYKKPTCKFFMFKLFSMKFSISVVT